MLKLMLSECCVICNTHSGAQAADGQASSGEDASASDNPLEVVSFDTIRSILLPVRPVCRSLLTLLGLFCT
jgi:hypothetical protein